VLLVCVGLSELECRLCYERAWCVYTEMKELGTATD